MTGGRSTTNTTGPIPRRRFRCLPCCRSRRQRTATQPAPSNGSWRTLLPEGRALDITATTYHVSKSNIFTLINELGKETTSAFRFLKSDEGPPSTATTPPREATRDELSRRLNERDSIPLAVWDGKVRMSIAGVQDKLMVYLDRSLEDGGRMFLLEPPLASTHILKPEPGRTVTPHLVESPNRRTSS